MDQPAVDGARLGLTSVERAGVLGVVLLAFAFGAGPVWRNAWNPDASILWSYAAIPPLVLAVLTWKRRLRLREFLSETLLLSIFKFGITAIVLIGLWSFSTPPAVHATEQMRDEDRPRGSSSNGKEGETEAHRESPVSAVVDVGGGKIVPEVIVLVSGAPVMFRSADGRLHALELFAADGSVHANVPILASGVPRALSFEEISRASSLHCAIHPGEAASIKR